MITHYGLFWSVDDVFWGWRGQMKGREKVRLERRGAPSKEELKKSKNYRGYIGLYALYGEGKLIYVGETGLNSKKTIYDRLKEHRKDSLADRWDQFSWFGRKECDGKCSIKISLAQLEAIAIALINPGFNKQSGSFQDAIQVFQVPHPKADGDMLTQIARLSDQMRELKESINQLSSQSSS